MKIKPEQLTKILSQGNTHTFLVSGDDPFLKEECLHQLRKHALQQGFLDRHTLPLDAHTQWQTLQDTVLEIGLFSQKKLIELQMSSTKLNANNKTGLLELLQLPLTDIFLILHGPKCDPATTKSKWYKQFDTLGAHVEVWPIDERQFPHWVKQRLQAANLPTSPALIQALATFTAGNLLATQQEIEKLSLLKGSETELIASLTNAARYTIFDLVKHSLLGHLKHSKNILETLLSDGSELVLILWALAQEIRLSLRVKQGLASGKAFGAICQSLYIWPARRPAIQQYIARFETTEIQQHLQACAKLDKIIKGVQPGKPAFALLTLITTLCGCEVTVCT